MPEVSQTGFLDPHFVKYYEQTDNTRQVDIPFYLSIAKAVEGPVLDAGCGSGRVTTPLLQAGVTVDGFDSSPVMLEELSMKLSEKQLSARVWVDRLDEFTCEPNHYPLALCSFNTFLHLMTHEAQLNALRRFHKTLRPGGQLVFDITNPFNFDIFSRKAMGKTFEATMYDSATDTETSIWRWFERDLVNQTGTYHREYESTSEAGKSTHTTQIEFRWTYPSEMKLLLQLAGFSASEVFGDFDHAPLEEDSEMQVWIATK